MTAPHSTQPAWLLPPRPPVAPWHQHRALWLTVTGVFVFGAVLSYWQILVPLAVVTMVAAVWWGRRDYRRREHDRLRRAADEGHRRSL